MSTAMGNVRRFHDPESMFVEHTVCVVRDPISEIDIASTVNFFDKWTVTMSHYDEVESAFA